MDPARPEHDLLRERDARLGAEAERDRLEAVVAAWEPWIGRMRAELTELRSATLELRAARDSAQAEASRLGAELRAVRGSREHRLGAAVLRPLRRALRRGR